MVDVATLRYKLVAVINNKKYNITSYTENLSWEENCNEISGRITFTCRNSNTKDGKRKYTEVASGTVVTWTPANQSSSHDFKCVCYDMLYNLQKSQDNFFFRSGTGTKTRINKILGKWKVPLGRYEGPDKKHGKKKYQNKYLSDILLNILDDAVKKGGKKSVIRMEKGKVSIIPEGSNKDIYVFKGNNINAAIRNRSIDGLVTRVKVVGRSKEKGREKTEAVLDGLTKYVVLPGWKLLWKALMSHIYVKAIWFIYRQGASGGILLFLAYGMMLHHAACQLKQNRHRKTMYQKTRILYRQITRQGILFLLTAVHIMFLLLAPKDMKQRLERQRLQK